MDKTDAEEIKPSYGPRASRGGCKPGGCGADKWTSKGAVKAGKASSLRRDVRVKDEQRDCAVQSG